MALADDLRSDVDSILNQEWSIRVGTVVPTTESVALSGGAVRLTATILYADLADSTELAMQYDRRVAAKFCKSFLACSSRIIRSYGGEIRSFDGDRVMAVFLGNAKDSIAAKCALKINWAFLKVLKPKIETKYSKIKDGSYKLAHCVGVDTSDVLVVHAGVRDNNDLIWIGRAPNVAAKLSAVRQAGYHSFVTKEVYDQMSDGTKYSSDEKKPMWQQATWKAVEGVETVYRSAWTWPC